jgi:ribosomal protein L9
MSAVLSVPEPGRSRGDDEVARLRIPPHSIEAEQSVLGGLLIDNGAWDRAGDLLVEGDFYRYEHRLIYAAIGALINATKPADVITVYEQLQSLGKAEGVGGLTYLNALAQSVPSAANLRRYAEIVRERAILRKLVAASDEIATNAFNPQGRPVSQILDEAEGRIFKIGEEGSRARQGFQSMDSLVVQLIDRVTELAENGAEEVTGVRTGFYDLDRMTAGLQPGDLIVLAARRATEAAVKEFETRRADLEKAAAAKLAASQSEAEKLAGKSVSITQKAGVDGRLFGSVTNHDIAEALNQQGFSIAKSQVRLPNGPLKTVGEHPVTVALHTDVVVDINVTVVGETD